MRMEPMFPACSNQQGYDSNSSIRGPPLTGLGFTTSKWLDDGKRNPGKWREIGTYNLLAFLRVWHTVIGPQLPATGNNGMTSTPSYIPDIGTSCLNSRPITPEFHPSRVNNCAMHRKRPGITYVTNNRTPLPEG